MAVGEKVSVENAFLTHSKMARKSGKIVPILQLKKEKRNLMNLARNGINENWGKKGIYVNNFLTYTNRNLFYKTKLFTKEKTTNLYGLRVTIYLLGKMRVQFCFTYREWKYFIESKLIW